MKQIFHHYEKWEDWRFGFYDSMSGKAKEKAIQTVIEVFSDPELTELLMRKVIKEWPISCEQNLSNPNMNKIAWLGQASLSLGFKIPQNITMKAWSEVPKNFREKADIIANNIIKEWEKNYD